MKRSKKQNKEILNVVNLAKEYVKEGETYINSIKKAQKEVRKQEKEMYESGC